MPRDTDVHGWTVPEDGQDHGEWGTILEQFYDDLDARVELRGVLADRPAAADVPAGTKYRVDAGSEQGAVFVEDGSDSWVKQPVDAPEVQTTEVHNDVDDLNWVSPRRHIHSHRFREWQTFDGGPGMLDNNAGLVSQTTDSGVDVSMFNGAMQIEQPDTVSGYGHARRAHNIHDDGSGGAELNQLPQFDAPWAIRTTFDMDSWASTGIVGLSCGFDSASSHANINFRINGAGPLDPQLVQSDSSGTAVSAETEAPDSFAVGAHSLTLQCDGSTIFGYVDGSLQIETSMDLPAGTVGDGWLWSVFSEASNASGANRVRFQSVRATFDPSP